MDKTSAVVNPAPEGDLEGPSGGSSSGGSSRSETSGGSLRSEPRSGGGERPVSIDVNTIKGVFIPFAEAFEEVTKLHGYALVGSG